MKLKNGIMRPGTVVQVLENNIIRADVPGLFSRQDEEKLPPIYPFAALINCNSYSQIQEYDEVWVLNFSDNPLQLYWLRKDDVAGNNKEIITEENVEVVCNREAAMGWATIYFSDGSGWIIRNAESVIQIRADGSIKLDANMPNRIIDINSDCISLGSEGTSEHPAAYGDVVADALTKIKLALNLIKQAANSSPYTKPISIAIGTIPNELETLINQSVSTNVTLD